MKIEDEPLEQFYPICTCCGEPIYGDGIQIGDDFYCEDCAMPIDGNDIAVERRESAYDAAMELQFEAGRDKY